MYRGGCLCGTIRYEVTGEIREIGHCHCKMCQKAGGTAFSTFARVERDDFNLVQGRSAVGNYESSPDTTRTFCRECGSSLQFIRAGRAYFGIAVGTFDEDLPIQPSYQIWTGSRASWWQLQDGLESHESEPGE